MTRTVRAYLLLLVCLNAAWTGVADADVQPEQSKILERLEQLDAGDAGDRTLRSTYQKALSALQSAEQYRQQTASLRQQIEEHTARLDALATRHRPAAPLPADLERLELAELESLYNGRKAALVSLTQRQSALENELHQNDQKLVNLPEQINTLKQTLSGTDRQEAANEAEALLAEAEFDAQSAHIEALELELLVVPNRAELLNRELEQLRMEIGELSQGLDTLEQRLQKRRRSETEQAISALEQPVGAADHPALQEATRVNQALSETLRQILEDTEQAHRRRQELGARLEAIRENYRSIEAHLDLDVDYVGIELRRLLLQLSRELDIEPVRRQVNNQRLQNLELKRELSQAATTPAAEGAQQLSPTGRDRHLKLIDDQLTLKSRVLEARRQLISELSQLSAVQEQINAQIVQNRELLNRSLLWIPSMNAIDLGWPAEVAEGFGYLNRILDQQPALPRWHWPERAPTLLITLVIALLLSLWLNVIHRRRENAWRSELGNAIKDRMSHSLWLVVAAPLIALPLPLALILVEKYALDPAHPLEASTEMALRAAALAAWFYHSMLIWSRRPAGLFVAHLNLPPPLVRLVRKRLTALFLLALPCLLVVLYTNPLDGQALRSGLMRGFFILLVVILGIFWGSLLPVARHLNQLSGKLTWWKHAEIWLSMMVLANVLLLVLILTGYTFTALHLIGVLTLVVAAVLIVFLVHRLALRWLLIEERKLAFSRAKARRAEVMAAREANEEPHSLSENYLDLQAISDQARVLLGVAALGLGITLLWLFVGDLLPSLDVLDRIALWSGGESGEELIPITLANILRGLLVLGVAFIGAYNLPGILELAVLRHLDLGPGSNYALTTLLKYLLIVIGLFWGFSEFGLEWNKLQWLVAALGVGLGFGLQEIVANFVSGLIILFEKPVRIGDTVTVGELTGTVTRIQIRATTITDWDRKEVLIPNKRFITDRLVNWSLSDAITRLVIPVGVAYGTDTKLARQLLLEVARDNNRILTDPAPEAFFTGFGDSALNLELRVHVSSMPDRLPATDELHGAIDDQFRRHGIEIAFPQLDVHLKRAPSSRQARTEPPDSV